MDVVVPAYNEEAESGACLDHIAGRRYPADASSTDATADVVAARPDANVTLGAAAGRSSRAGDRRGRLRLGPPPAPRAARMEDPALAPAVAASFTTLHLGYAIGLVLRRESSRAVWR